MHSFLAQCAFVLAALAGVPSMSRAQLGANEDAARVAVFGMLVDAGASKLPAEFLVGGHPVRGLDSVVTVLASLAKPLRCSGRMRGADFLIECTSVALAPAVMTALQEVASSYGRTLTGDARIGSEDAEVLVTPHLLEPFVVRLLGFVSYNVDYIINASFGLERGQPLGYAPTVVGQVQLSPGAQVRFSQ